MTWCETCQNTGEIDCYCGGDLCVCLNYGVMECPVCHGAPPNDEDDALDAVDYETWPPDQNEEKADG